MTKLPEKYYTKTIDKTEDLVHFIMKNGNMICHALNKNSKSKDKEVALNMMVEIMRKNGDLWKFIEGHKPLKIISSNNYHEQY